MISGKGGTGKTSLCAGLAACLAMQGQRVLCIDLDVGLRNLDISLGMQEEAVLPFTSILRGEYTLENACPHPSQENLFLLTAPVTEAPEDIDAEAFRAMIAQARGSFDRILLDAPAGIGRLFRLACEACDEALVVCLPDPASQRDAARTADLLLAEREAPVWLAVNRVSRKLFSAMRATVDDVMDCVGLPLLGIVPEDADVTLAAQKGMLLTQYTFEGAALACLHMAKRLSGEKAPLMKI